MYSCFQYSSKAKFHTVDWRNLGKLAVFSVHNEFYFFNTLMNLVSLFCGSFQRNFLYHDVIHYSYFFEIDCSVWVDFPELLLASKHFLYSSS